MYLVQLFDTPHEEWQFEWICADSEDFFLFLFFLFLLSFFSFWIYKFFLKFFFFCVCIHFTYFKQAFPVRLLVKIFKWNHSFIFSLFHSSTIQLLFHFSVHIIFHIEFVRGWTPTFCKKKRQKHKNIKMSYKEKKKAMQSKFFFFCTGERGRGKKWIDHNKKSLWH